jgi:hypothetical protein
LVVQVVEHIAPEADQSGLAVTLWKAQLPVSIAPLATKERLDSRILS